MWLWSFCVITGNRLKGNPPQKNWTYLIEKKHAFGKNTGQHSLSHKFVSLNEVEHYLGKTITLSYMTKNLPILT
jgi:hypothetical protein